MPFHGYTPVPSPAGTPLSDASTLVHWHVREGEYVQADSRIATVRVGEVAHSMIICFPALIQQRLATEGAAIRPGENILKWAADGESIPYGKPYFRTQQA